MRVWKKGTGRKISLFLVIPLFLQIALLYHLFEKSYQLIEILMNFGTYLVFVLALYYNGWAEKYDLIIRSWNVMNGADRFKIQSEQMGKLLLIVIFFVGFEILIFILFQIKTPFDVESVFLGMFSSIGIYRSRIKNPEKTPTSLPL